jgi:hypothetical protein
MLKIFIILIIIIEIMLNIGILNFIIKNNVKLINMNLKLKNDFNIQLLNLKKSIKNKNIGNEEFNEIINKEYRKNQITSRSIITILINFCRNINEKLIHEFEDRIKLAKVIFNNITYNMFVYKNKDIVSYYISNRNK